jgi:hypothetical protein
MFIDLKIYESCMYMPVLFGKCVMEVDTWYAFLEMNTVHSSAAPISIQNDAVVL